MEYNFIIKHIEGATNSAADNLSRLPVCVNVDEGAPYLVRPTTAVTELTDVKKLSVFCLFMFLYFVFINS